MSESKAKELLLDLVYDLVGSVMFCLGVYTFAIKGGFAPGGVSGVALIVNHYTQWPVGTVSFVMNLPILLLTFRTLGRRFLFKSVRTIIISTLMMDLVFPQLPVYEGSRLLSALFSGIFMGAGLALIYMRGSSTGGSDFLIHAAKRRFPHLSFGQITLWMDAAVILAGWAAFGDIDAVLYGMVAVFAATIVTDKIICGAGSSMLTMVITNKGQQMADAIMDATGRGATLAQVTGAYSREPRDMVLCACGKSEVVQVRTQAHRVDPSAMVMICEAGEVFGEGFRPPELPRT